MALSPDVTEMDGEVALPRRNGELAFDAPWQGRALGMAVGLVAQLALPWEEFRQRLIAAVGADPARPYWESWLAALESLVDEHALVDG